MPPARLRHLAIVLPLAVLSNAAMVVGRSWLEMRFSHPVRLESTRSSVAGDWARSTSAFGDSISVVCKSWSGVRLKNESEFRSAIPTAWKPQKFLAFGFGCGNEIGDFAELELSGWPFRCCWGERGRFRDMTYTQTGLATLTLPEWPRPRRAPIASMSNPSNANNAYAADFANMSFPIVLKIAYRLQWPALFGNLLIHAALWSIPLIGITTVVRALAARGGQCLGCRYHLVGLAPNTPCPECGHQPPSAPSTR